MFYQFLNLIVSEKVERKKVITAWKIAFAVELILLVLFVGNSATQIHYLYTENVNNTIKTLAIIFWTTLFSSKPVRLYFLVKGIKQYRYKSLKIYTRMTQVLYVPLQVIATFCVTTEPKLFQAVERVTFPISFVTFTATIFIVLPRCLAKFKKEEDVYNCLTNVSTSVSTRQYVSDSARKLSENLYSVLISPTDITIDHKKPIGNGAYGTVYRAVIAGSRGRTLEAAAKCVHDDETVLRETLTLLNIGKHENIVEFLGITVSTYDCSFCIVTKFCKNGDLHSLLLRLKSNLSEKKLKTALSYFIGKVARDVCKGMLYLGKKKIIHGDLSSRNVLLDQDGTAKISDFGLSLKLYLYQQYAKKTENAYLPWRNMAVESLEDLKFSHASDVWAFGVMLWEIFSLGDTPYGSLEWTSDFTKNLRDKMIYLPKPKRATFSIYSLMERCWTICPNSRPTFRQLSSELETFKCKGNFDINQLLLCN